MARDGGGYAPRVGKPPCANGHRVHVTNCSECHRESAAACVIPMSAATPINADMVTTLAIVPGFRIARALGVVTELSATSGWTAGWKGTTALEGAMNGLRRSAAAMGANGVVGPTSSTFAAGGGITNMLGPDAVGVLLVGTAVHLGPCTS